MTTAVHVPNGSDRYGDRLMVEGVVPLARKVTTQDTNGGVFIFEHKDVGKGGPPRHLHYEQDEWLYALAGEFVVEIGDERFTLKQGDSVLAPRNVPHAWAHTTDEPGTLLFMAQLAGSMEAFFKKIFGEEAPFEWEELEKIYTAHGIIEMWWRATVCYRKIDGKWMITHEHASVPFDVESGLASLDIKP